MENPVARPGKDVAAAEPPMASPKAGTLDRVQEKPVSPAPKSDLGTSDTAMQQSKTQPMDGTPKPPPPASKTQPMDGAPKGAPQNDVRKFSDEHNAAMKREIDAMKAAQRDPKSPEKQQAYQDAKRAAEPYKIEATQSERNVRVEAQKQYDDAVTNLNAAKAARDKLPENTPARAQAEKKYKDAYDRAAAADSAYKEAHMKEIDAWAKAGGTGGMPPKDIPGRLAANPPSPASPPPLPPSTRPMNPVAQPERDLGTADTTMQQSQTQPMNGAPKPPPEPSKTQQMDAAPKPAPSTPYTDEHLAAVKREAEAFKNLQNDPDSSAKRQAFQEAQRAADEHRIEATRAERDARVGAEKRYGEAETELDAAKANRDKVPATDTAGRAAAERRYQEAYDKLDKANDDYNKAHMKEVDAWGKAGGMRAPPTDVPPHSAEAPSPASQSPKPLPSATRPMENPVARPDNASASSGDGGTRPINKPSPSANKDLGMADTAMQSKTQPMTGAPKPPPQIGKTQPMDGAPKGQPQNDVANFSDEHKAAMKREVDALHAAMNDQDSLEKRQAYRDAQRAAEPYKIEATRAERNARVEAKKQYDDAVTDFNAAKAARDGTPASDIAARAQAEQKYKDAYDRVAKADSAYKDANMTEIDAWAKAGGTPGMPPRDIPGASTNGNEAARPSEAASGDSANSGGAGGANATLAMGLSNLASTIQKGP